MDKKEEAAVAEARPLADRLAEQMIQYIIAGNLQSGDCIGTEKELTERFGAGRSSIREAIKILVSRNVLEVRHGSGTFVADKLGVSEDPLGLDFIRDKFQLTWDLLEIRQLIEPRICGLAALHATEEQIGEMEGCCSAMDRLLTEGKSHNEEAQRFHALIAESSGNLVAPSLVPVISRAVDLFIRFTARDMEPEQTATHREILEAIRSRDPSWASDAMSLHLAYNRSVLRRMHEQDKAGQTPGTKPGQPR